MEISLSTAQELKKFNPFRSKLELSKTIMSRNHSNNYQEDTRSISPRDHDLQKGLSQAHPTPPIIDSNFLKNRRKWMRKG